MVHAERPVIEIELVFADAPHQIERETLQLPVGVTVAEACAASALATRLGFGAGAGLDGGNGEKSITVAYRPSCIPATLALQNDGCVGNHCTRRVGHGTRQSRRNILRVDSRNRTPKY